MITTLDNKYVYTKLDTSFCSHDAGGDIGEALRQQVDLVLAKTDEVCHAVHEVSPLDLAFVLQVLRLTLCLGKLGPQVLKIKKD